MESIEFRFGMLWILLGIFFLWGVVRVAINLTFGTIAALDHQLPKEHPLKVSRVVANRSLLAMILLWVIAVFFTGWKNSTEDSLDAGTLDTTMVGSLEYTEGASINDRERLDTEAQEIVSDSANSLDEFRQGRVVTDTNTEGESTNENP